MIPEKYSNPPQAPPLFTGTKESILQNNEKKIDSARAFLDKLVADVTVEDASFESVVLAMARMWDEGATIDGFYSNVSSDPEIREASTAAKKAFSTFFTECITREDIFQLVDSAYKKDEDLNAESKKLLFEERRHYIRNGLGLPPGTERDRLKEIKEKLSTVCLEFQKNLNEDAGGLWFTLEELEGVPQDVIDGFEKGTAENADKFKMTFKYTDRLPVMRYAKNIETRKQVYIAAENRVSKVCCSEPNASNV
jgi:metallopeptidase MepB